MFGPDYTAGCPACSAIADGFNGFVVHLANHDVTLSAVSQAPLAKLQAYKRRMGWTFPWASSLASDFNSDFNVSFTEEQQREGPSNTTTSARGMRWARSRKRPPRDLPPFAAMTGTDVSTYTRERPGMSAFVLQDGVVYTPIPPMRADWTASGACTSGSTSSSALDATASTELGQLAGVCTASSTRRWR